MIKTPSDFNKISKIEESDGQLVQQFLMIMKRLLSIENINYTRV